jgi:hypothetical protein
MAQGTTNARASCRSCFRILRYIQFEGFCRRTSACELVIGTVRGDDQHAGVGWLLRLLCTVHCSKYWRLWILWFGDVCGFCRRTSACELVIDMAQGTTQSSGVRQVLLGERVGHREWHKSVGRTLTGDAGIGLPSWTWSESVSSFIISQGFIG